MSLASVRSLPPLPPRATEAPLRFDLAALLGVLHRNRMRSAAILGGSLLAGLLLTLCMTPSYVATASIQIDQEADRVFEGAEVEPANGNADAERFLQTQVDVLRSRALALRVARRLDLSASPVFFKAMGEPVPGDLTTDAGMARAGEMAARLLQAQVAVDLPRNSRVASIHVQSADPALAARIANAYAAEFIQANLQRRFDGSAYARDFLARQLATAQERLEQSERALNDYARAAQLIRTGGGTGADASGSVTSASLAQLNAAANDARAGRIAAEQKWRSVAGGPVLNIPDVLANQAVQRLLEQRATGAAALQRERARHLSDYPSVRQLESQQAETDRQVTAVANAIRTSIYDQYRDALGREAALIAQVDGLKNATLAEQDRSVRYTILSREADTSRALYDGLLQRFKQLSAAAGVSANNIAVLDQAEPPTSPASPHLALNLVAALAAGLVIAGVAVLLREQLDDSVHRPDQVEPRLGLPLLGAIPRAARVEAQMHDLHAPVVEAYAALVANLLHAAPHGLPRSLLVTSAEAGEGKSSTSLAIAAGLARLGKRVVLVDADLRRPTLQRMLSAPRPGGLNGVLTREVPLDWAVQPAGPVGFAILPAGDLPPSPSRLLGSAALSDVLTQLGERFEVVVLDGPPVLGLADAPMLAAQAEATLFVVEADRRSHGAAHAALRRLQAGPGLVLGAVLTKFELPRGRVGRAYYGGDYHQNAAPALLQAAE